MRAFDPHIERALRDGKMDYMGCRSLSRDVDAASFLEVRQQRRNSVAHNFFAMACPIMPVGLLGAFFMLGRLDDMEANDQIKKVDALELARQQSGSVQALYMAAMKQKWDRDKKNDLSCSRQIDGLATASDQAVKKEKRASMLVDGKVSKRVNGTNLLSRDLMDPGKIVKQKLAMQTTLADVIQQQDYSTVCRVSAQIDLLDKALKKLGA